MRPGIFGFGGSLMALAIAGMAQRAGLHRLQARALIRHGPGRLTLDVAHKRAGTSKYAPHQGRRECERRLAKGCGMPMHRLVPTLTGGWTTERVERRAA